MSRFTDYIRNRLLRQNKNFLAAIVGPTGSGKSYSGLRLAEQVDPDFDIDKVAFTPQEFMDLLNSGKLKKGSAIIFDEAGVAINSRNFQTMTNKLLHFINQTFRSNNYCVIYTLPDFSFLDVGIRKLVHVVLETKAIDFDRELVWLRPLMIENNPQSGKVYMKYPRFRYPDNPRLKQVITKIYCHKPSKELVKAYEEKKKAFNKTLQADVQASLTRKAGSSSDPREKSRAELKAIYSAIKADKEKYLTPYGNLNEGMVSLEFGIGIRKMNRLKQLLLADELSHSESPQTTKRKTKTKPKK